MQYKKSNTSSDNGRLYNHIIDHSSSIISLIAPRKEPFSKVQDIMNYLNTLKIYRYPVSGFSSSYGYHYFFIYPAATGLYCYYAVPGMNSSMHSEYGIWVSSDNVVDTVL